MNNNEKIAYIILSIISCLSLLLLIVHSLIKSKDDNIGGDPIGSIDIYYSIFWIFSHFVLYFVLGLLIPNKWFFIFITMIVWELFEKLASKTNGWWGEHIRDTISDIIANTIGYYSGTILLKQLCK
jgi:hypothetical protein